MESNLEAKRQFLEEWGPFMLSGIPMLLAFYTAFTTIPTRPLMFDPMVYFMVMASFLGLGFLIANLFGRRSIRGLRLLALLGAGITLPALFFPSLTLTGVSRLCAISVIWGMVALIGKFNGFWWITRPLAKLNGYAAAPEEWAKAWIADMYAEDEYYEHPELALERARADWEAMVQEGIDPRTCRPKRAPTVFDRLWAFIKDEPGNEPGEQQEIVQDATQDVMKARRAAATTIAVDPDDYSPTANLLRKYQNGKSVITAADGNDWAPAAFAHADEELKVPLWKRLVFGADYKETCASKPSKSQSEPSSNFIRTKPADRRHGNEDEVRRLLDNARLQTRR